MKLTATDAPDPVSVGELLTLQLSVTNQGSATASGVMLVTTLSPNATFFSGSASQGSVTHSNGIVTGALGSLAAGASATVSLVVTPGRAGGITNVAEVNEAESDQNPSDNATTLVTLVAPVTFYQAGNLVRGRHSHTATLLQDGRILIAGGITNVGNTASAEIYDPATLTSTVISNMTTERSSHTATLLANGKVLVVGGQGYEGPVGSTELFDPVSGTFSPSGNLGVPRFGHTATLLSDGRVLIVGGYGHALETTVEIYNPSNGLFTTLGMLLSYNRQDAKSIRLADDRVFIGGGLGTYGYPAFDEIYDVPSNTVRGITNPMTAVIEKAIAPLNDGRILYAGGFDYYNAVSGAAILSPSSGALALTGNLIQPRRLGKTLPMGDGRVLIWGGQETSWVNRLTTTEVYDPVSGQFTPSAALNQARLYAAAVGMPDGRVFILGGQSFGGSSLASVEWLVPATTKPPPAFYVDDTTASEGDDTTNMAVFTIRLSAPLGGTATVNYATIAGTATSGIDFQGTNGLAIFPPGTVTQWVNIPIVGDRVYEADGTFSLQLTNPTNAAPGRFLAQAYIPNDDPPPTLTVLPASVWEPNTGATNLDFQVQLSVPSEFVTSVSFFTSDGTATGGSDYVSTNGVLVFPPGITNQSISVVVSGDVTIESNEVLYLNLTNATNATISPALAGGTILNDDGWADVTDHFTFTLPSPPRYETFALPLTITARDAFGNVATNFEGRVRLTGSSATQPSYLFDFEEGALTQWPPLNTGSSPGPYLFRSMDVNDDGNVSLAFGLIPNNGTPDGVYRFVELRGGVKYYLSMDIAQLNEGGATYLSGTTAYLRVNGTDLATHSFTSYISPGQIQRTNLTATFLAPTNGLYNVAVLFDRGFAENGDIKIFADDVKIAAPRLTPAFPGNFSHGVWSGFFTPSDAVTNYSLRADDLDGHISESAPFDILSYADLAVQAAVSPNPARVGSNLTFTVTVTNLGPGTATDVVLTNPLPAELTFLSATSTNGPCDFTNSAVVCGLGTLASQQSAVVTIVTRPTLPVNVTNADLVAATSFDPDSTNNATTNLFAINPPLLYVAGPTVVERAGTTTNAQFIVSVGTPFVQTIEVDYATANGTALAGTDYVATAGHLIFTAGVTSQVVNVTVLDDLANEPDETFALNLSNPVNAQFAAGGPANATIRDNFDLLPWISVNDTSVAEGDSGTNNLLAFAVTLNQPSGRTVSVAYNFAPGTAANGSDYTNILSTPPYTLTFPPYTVTQMIYLRVVGDTVNEPDETALLLLTTPVSNAALLRRQGVGAILNDDSVTGKLDHFEWSVVPSPRVTSQSFPVTLTARDAFNNLFTGVISNTVNLTARGGTGNVAVALSPTTAGAFVNGVWNGNLAASTTATNIVLRADDSRGRIGLSNPFNTVTAGTLLLAVPASANENAGVLVGQGIVSRAGNFGSDLTVTLTSSDATELTVPASVLIPAGQSNAAFDLTIADDAVLDGSQSATLTATGAGFVGAMTTLIVDDNETATITLTNIPASIVEGTGNFTATITLNAPPETNVVVSLTSSDASELRVPANITFVSGQDTRTFTVTNVNDLELDGPQPVTLTAHVPNWTDGVVTSTVFDNETNTLTFKFSPTTPSYTERQGYGTNLTVQLGGVSLTNLALALNSSDTSEIILPATVTIPPGTNFVQVPLTIVDDAEYDGTQAVTLTASAAGFVSAVTNVTVNDSEIHHYVFDAIATPQQGSVGFSVTIRARDVNNASMAGASAYLSLSASGDGGPVTITPASVTLSGGVWTGTITVPAWEYQNVRITALDSEGVSGQSAPFDVNPPTAYLTGVNAHDLVYSESTRLIYAGYINTGTLTPVDPFYATVGTPASIGAFSGKLCVGDGGQFVFASLSSSNRICQFDVHSQSIIHAWSLGGMTVEDMTPIVGSPAAVAVSRRNGDWSPHFAGVAIYDNGVARSNIYTAFLGANVIEPSGTPGRLYGYCNESSSGSTQILNYDASGIYYAGSWGGLQGYTVNFACRAGLIFATSGQIFDPLRNQQIGTFTGSLPVAEDAPSGRFYIISSGAVTAYDAKTLLPVGVTATGLSPTAGTSSTRWGSNGIAFCAASRVALVRTPLIASGPPADLVLSFINAAGPVAAGSNFTYTLAVSNAGPNTARGVVIASTISANAQFISAVPTSGTVTQAAGGLVCSLLTISNGATASVNVTLKPLKPGLLTSMVSTTSDSLDPNLTNNSTVVNTPANAAPAPDSGIEFALNTTDLVSDTNSGRLFMSVPNADRWLGNHLLPLNPATGLFDAPVATAMEPGKLAVSDNGQFLYIGLNSEASIQRIALASRTVDLKFPTQLGGVADMAVLPGAPQSVAATAYSTFAIYDNGVMRSNTVGPSPYNYSYNLAFSSSNTLAYEALPTELRRIGIDSSGATVLDSSGLINDFDREIKFDSGRLFTAGGRVIDPEAHVVITNLPYGGLVCPDSPSGKVFYLAGSGANWTLHALNFSNFQWAGSVPITNVSGTPSSLVRWGTDGLAFRTSGGQIFLLRTTLADDRDNDSLADSWERQYFPSYSSPNSGANDDPDGDAMSNSQEWRAGLNPVVYDAVRFLTQQPMANGAFQMTALVRPLQPYVLFASTNLHDWVPLTNFSGTNLTPTLVDAASANYALRFYRLGPQSDIPPPSLGFGVPPLASNEVNLILSGFTGIGYRLQTSTNLVDWFTVTNVTSTNDLMPLRDPSAPNDAFRFYRVTIP